MCIILTYISYFITYLAIYTDTIFFKVKENLLILILSYIIVNIVKKLIKPKNMKLISIYPLSLKNIVYDIQLYEYTVIVFLITSIFIPDLLLEKTSINQYLFLIVYVLCAINIEYKVTIYIIIRYKLMQYLSLIFTMLLIVNVVLLELLYTSFKIYILLIMLLILMLLHAKYKKLYSDIYELSYISCKESNWRIGILIKKILMKFSDNYLYRREVERVVRNGKFQIRVFKTILVYVLATLFLYYSKVTDLNYYNITILMAANNFFSSTMYYDEKIMYITRDIMPLDDLGIFKVKIIVNTMLQFIVCIPFILSVILIMKISWYINIIFILVTFSVWSFICGVIDKIMNYDKRIGGKNPYTRFLALIFAVMHLLVLNDMMSLSNRIYLNILCYIIYNSLFIFFGWRIINARVDKSYKEI